MSSWRIMHHTPNVRHLVVVMHQIQPPRPTPQVLGSNVTMAPSGLVLMLSIATVFMVDIGSRLSLPGWSGVLSVIAQYRADDTYSSKVATRAVLAVRSGRANFASVRDLAASTVPTVWYPLLALGAEASGRNAGWGSCICVVAVGSLVYAHGLKLLTYGNTERDKLVKQATIAFTVMFYPLTYRLTFYNCITALISWVYVRVVTGSFTGNPGFDRPSTRLFYAFFAVGTVVEMSIIGSRYGWDPEVSSTAIRLRWIAAGVVSLIVSYFTGDGVRGGKHQDPERYTLSGWSHVKGDIRFASRYIVDYGSGTGVRTDGEVDGNYYTLWRG